MDPESPAAFLLSAGSLSSAQCRQNYDDQRMQLRTGWAFGLMRSHRADVQRDRVEELDTTLLVCEPALAESMHLLARFSKAHDALFGILRNGALTIAFRIDEDISALRPHQKYQDRPMSLAECIVRMAERAGAGPM